ncbi:MAG: hypothetical protein Q4C98_10100, partial [Capnocytophaga sp.]|nr:hypothetical protein [Capnocytophaga sp.]
MLNKNNYKQNFISPEKFEFYCQTGTEYEGFVVGKGYAWVWDGMISPLDYAPRDWRFKYKTDTVMRYTLQVLDTSSNSISKSLGYQNVEKLNDAILNNEGGWIELSSGDTIWDSRVYNEQDAKRYWGSKAKYREKYLTGNVKTSKGKDIKNALLEPDGTVIKDGQKYYVPDMAGKEPMWIKFYNTLKDNIILEVEAIGTVGNKLSLKYWILQGNIDLGSIEVMKAKTNLISPEKSSYGFKEEPPKGTIGGGISVGLGKKSNFDFGMN